MAAGHAPGPLFEDRGKLRAYKTAEVSAWAAAHQDQIERFYWPTCAPELNATEYLNNDLKSRVNAAPACRTQGRAAVPDATVYEQAAMAYPNTSEISSNRSQFYGL